MTSHTLHIRADAHADIGAGHVMRCLALAQAHADAGGRVVFAGRIEGAGILARLAEEGFAFVSPTPGMEAESGGGCAALLAASGAHPGDPVVLDGYTFNPDCARQLREAGYVVLELDDFNARETLDAHAVLNPDPAVGAAAYPIAPQSVVLTGPRYRLLRREFATATPEPLRDLDGGARALVTFGGADKGNASCAAIAALADVLGPKGRIRVAVGPVNPHREALERAASEAACECELLFDVRDMPELMRWADVAVSAAGGTAWELAALGVPAVLVPVADNQRPGAAVLSEAGAALALDGPDDLGGEDFRARLGDLLASRPVREAMRTAGRALCDGRGAQRVLRVLAALSGAGDDFTLRETRQDDAEQVFRLANDPDKRRFAFSPEPIPLAGHLRWFAAKLDAPDTAMYVLDCAGAVAAEVRYDADGEEAEIDVSVLAAFRGNGLGPRILTESREQACERLGVTRLRAEVFAENAASRRCFEKAGFVPRGEETINGRPCAVYTWEKGA